MDNTELIKRKLMDADRTAYDRNILKLCGFLSLEEQSIYRSIEREFMSSVHFLAGGNPDADRNTAFFLPDYMDKDTAENEAIGVVMVRPVNAKFADELTHRDYLGALMNLGIERECIGDILTLKGESGRAAYAVIFVLNEMAEYVCRELTKVRHTSVECSCMGLNEYRNSNVAFTQEYEEIKINIASERVDAVIAALYRVSRQKAADVINAERVFINGQTVSSAGKTLKEGDRVSVRGTGKFIFDGINGSSRKGRLYADIRKYV